MRFLAPRHLFPRFLVPDKLFLRFWDTFISALFGHATDSFPFFLAPVLISSCDFGHLLHLFPYFYAAVISISAEAYPGFCTMKQLGIFLLPPGWDASPSQGYPPALNSPVPICTPVTVLPKYATPELRPELKPGQRDLEWSALTMKLLLHSTPLFGVGHILFPGSLTPVKFISAYFDTYDMIYLNFSPRWAPVVRYDLMNWAICLSIMAT